VKGFYFLVLNSVVAGENAVRAVQRKYCVRSLDSRRPISRHVALVQLVRRPYPARRVKARDTRGCCCCGCSACSLSWASAAPYEGLVLLLWSEQKLEGSCYHLPRGIGSLYYMCKIGLSLPWRLCYWFQQISACNGAACRSECTGRLSLKLRKG
jgi:hypothetical protein